LNNKCKRYKRNKKTEKEKREKKKKIEKGLGGDLSAQTMKQPAACLASPELVPSFPSPSLTAGPTRQRQVIIFNLGPRNSPETEPTQRFHP
jgi:hypothetical protein